MNIETLQWANAAQTELILTTASDRLVLPWPCATWHRELVAAWLDLGNTISAPSATPPPPTEAELADAELARNQALRGLVRVLAKRFNLPEATWIAAIKAELA